MDNLSLSGQPGQSLWPLRRESSETKGVSLKCQGEVNRGDLQKEIGHAESNMSNSNIKIIKRMCPEIQKNVGVSRPKQSG